MTITIRNKPCTDENAYDCQSCLETRIALAGNEIAYEEWAIRRIIKQEKRDKENVSIQEWTRLSLCILYPKLIYPSGGEYTRS